MSAALWHLFTVLRERGDQVLWCGVALAVVAYAVGPGRLPRAVRHGVAGGARTVRAFAADHAPGPGSAAEVRGRVRRHADVLRVAGFVLAALAALLLSSWAGLLVVAVLLACYEIAVTLAAGGAPPADDTAASAAGPR